MSEQEQVVLLREFEERPHDPRVRRSRDQASQLLADELVEIGRSGRVYHKQGIIQALSREQFVGVSPICDITDFAACELPPNAMLLTYRAIERSNLDRKTTSSWRCSIWRLIDHRWQMIFHQGTPILSRSEP